VAGGAGCWGRWWLEKTVLAGKGRWLEKDCWLEGRRWLEGAAAAGAAQMTVPVTLGTMSKVVPCSRGATLVAAVTGTMFAASRERHMPCTTSSSSSPAEVATPPDEVATPPDEVATPPAEVEVPHAATPHISSLVTEGPAFPIPASETTSHQLTCQWGPAFPIPLAT
jgi:hypothetical protein